MASLDETEGQAAKKLKLVNDETADVIALKTQYECLLSKKTALQTELQNVYPDRLANTLIREATGREVPDVISSSSQREILVRAVRTAERRKHENILLAYRLAGLSAIVKGTSARLTIETSHDGEYFEPFYVELEFADKIHLGCHTVPYFIPLKSIASSHLNSNMKLFVSTLSRYLNAYVSRRQQAYNVQQQHRDAISGSVDSSFAVDYVHFTLKPVGDLEEPLIVRLLYTDLKAMLPDKVNVKPKDSQSISPTVRKWCRQQKAFFKEHELPEALETLIASAANTK